MVYGQAVLHYGESIKAVMNEELGDGYGPRLSHVLSNYL